MRFLFYALLLASAAMLQAQVEHGSFDWDRKGCPQIPAGLHVDFTKRVTELVDRETVTYPGKAIVERFGTAKDAAGNQYVFVSRTNLLHENTSLKALKDTEIVDGSQTVELKPVAGGKGAPLKMVFTFFGPSKSLTFSGATHPQACFVR